MGFFFLGLLQLPAPRAVCDTFIRTSIYRYKESESSCQDIKKGRQNLSFLTINGIAPKLSCQKRGVFGALNPREAFFEREKQRLSSPAVPRALPRGAHGSVSPQAWPGPRKLRGSPPASRPQTRPSLPRHKRRAPRTRRRLRRLRRRRERRQQKRTRKLPRLRGAGPMEVPRPPLNLQP